MPRVFIQRVILARQNEVITRLALFGKHVAVTIGTEVLAVLDREGLAGDRRVAFRASEAFLVIRLAIITDATLRKGLGTNHASLNERLFVALHAHGQVLMSHESLGADWILAELTDKAFIMPKHAIQFQSFHAWFEALFASLAASSIRLFMAISTNELTVILGEKRSTAEGLVAENAQQTSVMPVMVVVQNILVLHRDLLVALMAAVGEFVVVAFDANRLLGLD